MLKTNIDPMGLYRVKSIARSSAKNNDPNAPRALFEMSAATWWSRVARGEAPQPIRSRGMTFWRGSDLLEYSARLGGVPQGEE